MKKILYFMILILIFAFYSFYFLDRTGNITGEKKQVKLDKCVDGDTANILLDGKPYVLRFLAINTKELDEEYGEEASVYTCNLLKDSKKIELEFDNNSELYDKYGRLLAWVFVDDNLLQLDLVSKGFAEVRYVYGDYKYLDQLYQAQEYAKQKNIGLWKIYY